MNNSDEILGFEYQESDLEGPLGHQGSESAALSRLLPGITEAFFFSYSPSRRCLVAWTNTCEQVLGTKLSQVSRDANLFLREVHPDDRFSIFPQLETALKGSNPYRATYRWLRQDSQELRWLHCRAALELDPSSPKEALFRGMIIDLNTELGTSVSALGGVDTISGIFAAYPGLMVSLDRDLRILRLSRNGGASNFDFGDRGFRPDLFRIGRYFFDCFSDRERIDQLKNICNRILEGKQDQGRERILVPNNSGLYAVRPNISSTDYSSYNLQIIPLDDHSNRQGLLLLAQDVSNLVQLEIHLEALQKAENFRLVAAGVAHHLNNALQTILGQATVISSHLTRPDIIRASSESIFETVRRASDLSRQLFVLDQSSLHEPVSLDLNLATMSAFNKVGNPFALGLKLGISFGSPPPILAVQSELLEALEVLLRHTLNYCSRGMRVSIKTFSSPAEKVNVSEKNPDLAFLAIECHADDIPSILASEQEIENHAEFFKARSLLRTSFGRISVQRSSLHEFRVLLSVPLAPLGAQAIRQNQDHKIPDAANNRADVLIIDDDILILQTIEAILQDTPWRCVTASNATAALRLARAQRGSIRLVLVDAMMPVHDGASVLMKIKRLIPNARILGFSGAPEEATRTLLEAGASEILRKPVESEALKSVLRRYLGTERAA